MHSGLEESATLVCSQLIIKAEALHGSHTFSTVKIKRTQSESSLLYKNDGKKSVLPSLFRINLYLGFVVKNLPKSIDQQYTEILLRKKVLIIGKFNKLIANILYGKKPQSKTNKLCKAF